MLKTYHEMRQIDVLEFCDMRKEKQNGKEIEIPYLNWAKCIDLLYENGAETVYFDPIRNPVTGSSLISSGIQVSDSNGNTNSIYETSIHIVIDNLIFDQQGPVMNGANPVKDNSMSQQRLWNSQCRLFVKGVAIRTGLGFDLWIKNENEEQKLQKQADVKHDIMKVRERVFEEFTALNKKGYSKADIAELIGMNEDELDMKIKMYVSLANMEKKLNEAMGNIK
nr:MAG TPA: Protein of unknown function (DUF1071) [Caudoviricetes sp.]